MLTSMRRSLGAELDLKVSLAKECDGEQSDSEYEAKDPLRGLVFCSRCCLLLIFRGPGVGLPGFWCMVDRKYC